jgi:uncharacterized OsmC-like protein
MSSEELRALQAPLKAKYKEDPQSAVVTLVAKSKLDENITALLETKHGTFKAGLHPATGGTGNDICSGDMLLEALAACAGVTLNAVATATGIEVKNATVTAEGDIDFRGTLGVSKEAPVGFKSIRLHFSLTTNSSQEKIDSLLRLTERYCVVYQTLLHSVSILTSHDLT